MEKDIVSVITTCYNVIEYVEYCISSVAQQHTNDTFSIEYILVNDASTDNSLELINKTIEHYKTSKLINDIQFKVYSLDTNLGCGGARKYGISKAHGKFIMFLDADDYYINHDFILRAHNDIVNYNADIVDYGIKFNNGNGQIFMSVSQNMIEYNNNEQALIGMFIDNTIKFNVWSKIYTRDIIETYPYSDTRTFEDVRTVPMWVYNSKKIVVMPTVEINYRSNPKSIIRENDIETRVGTCTAICDIMERFKDNINICKAFYQRAMIDLEVLLLNHTSYDPGFNEMSAINTKMLSYIYPDTYKDKTFNLEEKQESSENDETNKE